MKILITGHKGYIGTHLTKRMRVIGLDIKDGNDIVTCELPKADVVIHLAAKSDVVESMINPVETIRTNTLGTIRLWEKYKDTRFIFASTAGAIQDGISSTYGLSKYYAEELIKMFFSNYIILRLPNIYGAKGSRSVIDKFINEDIIIYGDGSQTRTFIHVDDLVNGIIASINWPKGQYTFGSDKTYTVLELAEATGKPISFADWRPGEVKYSNIKSTVPNWKSTIDVISYIKNKT